jgi:mxaK protein
MNAASILQTSKRALARSRAPALICLLIVCLGLIGLQSYQIWQAHRDERVIADLAKGIDRGLGARRTPELLLARVHFLLTKDNRLDEAQGLSDAPELRDAPETHAAIYYNLANRRVRDALSMIEKQVSDRAIPMIGLATEEYRQALRLTPGDWNIRYNLDFAMRLVSDHAQILPEQQGEHDREPSRKQNWTDLPSLPKGLP